MDGDAWWYIPVEAGRRAIAEDWRRRNLFKLEVRIASITWLFSFVCCFMIVVFLGHVTILLDVADSTWPLMPCLRDFADFRFSWWFQLLVLSTSYIDKATRLSLQIYSVHKLLLNATNTRVVAIETKGHGESGKSSFLERVTTKFSQTVKSWWT